MSRRSLTVFVLTLALAGGFTAVAVGLTGLTPIPAPPDPGLPEAPMAPETIVDEVESIGSVPCTSPQQDLNFPNYWSGKNFDNLDVTGVIRRCDLPVADEPIRANYVTYLYGDCVAEGDAGCAPPIEIQTWPAAERNRSTYKDGPRQLQIAGADTSVSGVPATRYEGRLEIYYSDATVVIFGDTTAQINLFAESLKRGPIVLAELSQYGLVFDAACITDPHYCVAKPLP